MIDLTEEEMQHVTELVESEMYNKALDYIMRIHLEQIEFPDDISREFFRKGFMVGYRSCVATGEAVINKAKNKEEVYNEKQ